MIAYQVESTLLCTADHLKVKNMLFNGMHMGILKLKLNKLELDNFPAWLYSRRFVPQI